MTAPATSAASLAPPQYKTPTRSQTAPDPGFEQIQAPSLATRSQSSGTTSTAHAITEREEKEEIDAYGSGRGAEESNTRLSDLESENSKLTGELRDAREKIRNLELQVEGMRANARKVAQALLNS